MHKVISSHPTHLPTDFCQSLPENYCNAFRPCSNSVGHCRIKNLEVVTTESDLELISLTDEPVKDGQKIFDKLFSGVFVRDYLKQLSEGKALIEDIHCSKHK